LKFDLFQRRYDIYEAAKQLIEHISFVTDVARSDPQKIRTFYVKLDEGRLYFPEDVRALLNEIHDQCEGFLGTWQSAKILASIIMSSGAEWLIC
jgi:hypothetical protein